MSEGTNDNEIKDMYLQLNTKEKFIKELKEKIAVMEIDLEEMNVKN